MLVHGFAGWVPEESRVLGDYWRYFSDPAITKGLNIFQADISSTGSIHDRACELYQQLIGIEKLRKLHGLANDDNSE